MIESFIYKNSFQWYICWFFHEHETPISDHTCMDIYFSYRFQYKYAYIEAVLIYMTLSHLTDHRKYINYVTWKQLLVVGMKKDILSDYLWFVLTVIRNGSMNFIKNCCKITHFFEFSNRICIIWKVLWQFLSVMGQMHKHPYGILSNRHGFFVTVDGNDLTFHISNGEQ